MMEFWHDSGCGFHPASAMDYLPAAQLRQLQLHRLQAVVRRAYEHVALFRERMDARGLTPADIECLVDIAKIPFTVKTDLRDTYPFGLFASPMSEVVRLHASSGTTGKPIVVAYTQEDLKVWASVMVRSFAACGLQRGDVIQNGYGYGLFTGGLGAHYGAEALGATVIPISGGNTDRQIMVMKDFGTTAICCTPSYFLRIIERAREIYQGQITIHQKLGMITQVTPIRYLFSNRCRHTPYTKLNCAAIVNVTGNMLSNLHFSFTGHNGWCCDQWCWILHKIIDFIHWDNSIAFGPWQIGIDF